ncbi:MAG: Nif3-like dinuclear metal center hexameric protein [Rhodocyclaceae bacterium]|nr:Nif3-like dinuclear metal center hexameric protein [Rhodocyclaceae bacterium]
MALLDLVAHLDALLEPERFRDYAPNGLQVEGRATVRRLVTGVTACQALLDAAVAVGADAVLVHHGYFWRNEPATLTGLKRKRIATLVGNDISLLAYHLPLDAHPLVGNNAGLGRAMGVAASAFFGEQQLGCAGELAAPVSAGELAASLGHALGREALLLGVPQTTVRRVGWCTGGAQGYFGEAIAAGVDAFVTGEVSEQCEHLARESGVAFIAAGHHATERFGVQSLAAHLADGFGLDCRFIDVPNPV